MQDYQAAMLQSLIAVAWADAQLHDKEVEIIDALIGAFGLDDEDARAVRDYGRTPRSLSDLPLSELSRDDRYLLLSHAVLLSYADGEPSPAELRLIDDLSQRLNVPPDTATPLLAAAHARAQRLAAVREAVR